jgi:hypothetical protein
LSQFIQRKHGHGGGAFVLQHFKERCELFRIIRETPAGALRPRMNAHGDDEEGRKAHFLRPDALRFQPRIHGHIGPGHGLRQQAGQRLPQRPPLIHGAGGEPAQERLVLTQMLQHALRLGAQIRE